MALNDAAKDEANIARKIIKLALERGLTISVNDGEEWTVKETTMAKAVEHALCTTDQDTIRLHEADGSIGSIYLVWGNGEDLISDCTDSFAMGEFMEAYETKRRSNY